jgi:hypothetical protein
VVGRPLRTVGFHRPPVQRVRTRRGRIEEYRQRFAQGTAFDDTVVSARFCLPAGTTYRLFRDAGCSDTAGPDACFDLVGTGSVEEIPRLEVMHPAFGRGVRSSSVVEP